MSSAQARASSTSSVDSRVPAHTITSVSGTKITVCSHSGGFSARSTTPITTASSRYSTDEAATAPPGLNRKVSPSRSASPDTNVDAVTSVNDTMT
jgi:hypothetical protein